MISPDTISVLLMMLGLGVFLGGLGASFDNRVYWNVAVSIMLTGMAFMLAGLIWWDMLGHLTPPFQVVIE